MYSAAPRCRSRLADLSVATTSRMVKRKFGASGSAEQNILADDRFVHVHVVLTGCEPSFLQSIEG